LRALSPCFFSCCSGCSKSLTTSLEVYNKLRYLEGFLVVMSSCNSLPLNEKRAKAQLQKKKILGYYLLVLCLSLILFVDLKLPPTNCSLLHPWKLHLELMMKIKDYLFLCDHFSLKNKIWTINQLFTFLRPSSCRGCSRLFFAYVNVLCQW